MTDYRETKLREYLEFHAGFMRDNMETLGYPEGIKYAGCEDWLLKHGRLFETGSRARPVGVRKLANKMCYGNAYRRSVENDWLYCEGYAEGAALMPVWHAWCLDNDGDVVETTWKELGSTYLGVVIPEDLLHEVMVETGYYGVLQNTNPSFIEKLLRGEYDERIDRENGDE